MARPIRSVVPTGKSDEAIESLGDVGEEVARRQDSLRNFLELLRLLDEQGVLRLVSDFVTANEELIRISVDWLSRPENLRTVQNVRVLLASLERIGPAQLERLLRELTRALDRASAVGPAGPRLGAFGLLRQLGDPETNRGLLVLIAALQGFGVDGA